MVFGRVSRFKQRQGTAVCSPPVADLYKAALMANNKLKSKNHGLPYIAALGVSCQYTYVVRGAFRGLGGTHTPLPQGEVLPPDNGKKFCFAPLHKS